MLSPKEKKIQLRQKIRTLPQSVGHTLKEAYDALICQQLIDYINSFHSSQLIGWYLPIGSLEPNILPALETLYATGKHQHALVSLEHQCLCYRLIPESSLMLLKEISAKTPLSPLSFPQKVQPSCYLIPGLGFNKKNARLGFGQGYFDRFITTLVGSPELIGLCYPWQQLDFDAEPHDLRCHKIFSGTR